MTAKQCTRPGGSGSRDLTVFVRLALRTERGDVAEKSLLPQARYTPIRFWACSGGDDVADLDRVFNSRPDLLVATLSSA
jgi:hypothetical protein